MTRRPTHAATTLDDWIIDRDERVDVIDWTNVPTGGDPFRGSGVFLGSENAVARVRLDDGTTRSFNRGDVTRQASR